MASNAARLMCVLVVLAVTMSGPTVHAACSEAPHVTASITAPDSDGQGALVITWSFPDTVSPEQRLITYSLQRPPDSHGPDIGDSFRPDQATGSLTIEVSFSCDNSGTYRFTVTGRACDVHEDTKIATFQYSAPSISVGISFKGVDEHGYGSFSITYSFPNTREGPEFKWQRKLTYIEEPNFDVRSVFVDRQQGVWVVPVTLTCRGTGQHRFRALGEDCKGTFDDDNTTVDISGEPTVSLNLSEPNDNGVITGTATYAFPNTDLNSGREVRFDRGNTTIAGPFFPGPNQQTGTFQFTYNISCLPPDPLTFTAIATACPDHRSATDSKTVTPQHTPVVSLALDQTQQPNQAVVTYSFAGTGSASQRTIRLEWGSGGLIGEVHPTTISGEERFTIPECHSATSLKAVAIACGDQSDEDTVTIAGGGPPTVSLLLDKGDLDTQAGRRWIRGEVTWDMKDESSKPWSVQALVLRWIDPDGTVSGGENVLDYVPDARTGTRPFTFLAPSGARNVTVEAIATSCAGRDTQEVSIECPICDDVTGNPVSVIDGNMSLSDVDPLPAIGRWTLTRNYNSDEQVRALFGRGWTTLFERRLIVNSDGADKIISIVTETNEVVTFRTVGGTLRQRWPQARSAMGTLSYDAAAGTYTHRAANSTEAAVFRASDGRLILLRDLATGRDAQLTYDAQGLPQSLVDVWSGMSWNLTTDATQKRVTSIAVSNRPDLVWSYSYDANGNLVAVTAPGPSAWRTYDYAANRMTASHDALGNLIESHTYDSNGRAISSTGSSDEIESVQYNLPGSDAGERITRITEKNGAVTDYVLRPSGGAFRSVRVIGGCASCGTRNTTKVRDVRGRMIREQSADGYVNTMMYEGEQLTSEQNHLRPAGCDPATDSNQCRIDTDALAGAELQTTTASISSTYAYGDPNWPERPTRITTPSIAAPERFRQEDITYHAVSGLVTSTNVRGWTGSERTRTDIGTMTTFYGDTRPAGDEGDEDEGGPTNVAAFNPGGTFSSAWLTLPQPPLLRRSINGPRTDADDVTQFVYFPIDPTVTANLRGRLAGIKNAAGHISRFEAYDAFGNVTRAVDPNGVVTEMTYDALGRPLTSTIKGVPGCDSSKDLHCTNDLTTTRTYSPAAGPLQSEQRPQGGVTTYTYDSRGRVRTVSRGASANDLREQLEVSYDATTGKQSLERTLGYESGSWVEKTRTSYSYNLDRQLQTMTHANGDTIGYAYDAAQRLSSVRDENHSTPNTFYTYDPAGRIAVTRQTLAGAPNGFITTQYSYDSHGNLTAVADPNGNVTSYTYDDFGRMLRQQSPVTGTTDYEYDEAGNLKTSIDANGVRSERSYDALNRIISAVSGSATSEPPPPRDDTPPPSSTALPPETITWSYDDPTPERYAIGRLASMTDPAGTTVYDYERRGLLTEELRTFHGCLRNREIDGQCDDFFATHTYPTGYRYDRDGNRITVRYPSTKLNVNYTFDYAGRPLTASGVINGAQYLPFGPLKQLTFANGTTQTMSYDNRYRVTENVLAAATGALARYRYEYDAAGNITRIQDMLDAGYDRFFGYDDLHRLTSANTGPALWRTASYTWDAMGNILSSKLGEVPPGDDDGLSRVKTDAERLPLGRSLAFTYDGTTSRLAEVATNELSRPVGYDAVGNETAYSVTRKYSPRNFLSQVTDAGEPGEGFQHTLTYAYDGRGVRAVRGETPSYGISATSHRYFLYSPELHLLSVTRDDSGNIYAFAQEDRDVKYEIVWFGDRPVAQIPIAGPRSYTFADHLGTPILQTDPAGSVTWRAEYEPFGNIYEMREGARADQPLRFPGQEVAMNWEGAEENYNIHRWYRSGWGRYTQSDPIGLAGGKNLYAYVGGNPITYIDSLGLARSPRDMNCCELGSEINRLKEELKRRLREEEAVQRQLVQGVLGRTYAQAIYRYWQHYGQYVGKQKRMNRLISEYDGRPCDPPLPQEVHQWAGREFPDDDYIWDSYRDFLEDVLLHGPPRPEGPVVIGVPSGPPPVYVAP